MSEKKSFRRLLIVESDFALARLTARVLRPHEILHAPTLTVADEMLARYDIDVLIFDPQLPGGFDFLVESAHRYPNLRLVAYSASRKAEVKGAFGLAHATLRKPATDGALREAVFGENDDREYRQDKRASE